MVYTPWREKFEAFRTISSVSTTKRVPLQLRKKLVSAIRKRKVLHLRLSCQRVVSIGISRAR